MIRLTTYLYFVVLPGGTGS